MNSVVNFKEYRTKIGLYEGTHVPLEEPMIEGPELNKPKRSSGPSKYVVYVKDPKTGNVKKINSSQCSVFTVCNNYWSSQCL